MRIPPALVRGPCMPKMRHFACSPARPDATCGQPSWKETHHYKFCNNLQCGDQQIKFMQLQGSRLSGIPVIAYNYTFSWLLLATIAFAGLSRTWDLPSYLGSSSGCFYGRTSEDTSKTSIIPIGKPST
ncbi:hypothetical protein MA16_Dca006423 [Dendrobium catenatum]|uniref:Uncharacterized protein n=1 Tax=Dendrobium catenatum TaxID=906689 RepID=A0A2I0X7Q0_9ASPA|nr:hypothetical protein MA16_Dca006423 [Dendrobium catenatum]